jgi:hypothetical protein
MSEPVLLNVSAPLFILGDIHGQFDDLLALIDRIGKPPGR